MGKAMLVGVLALTGCCFAGTDRRIDIDLPTSVPPPTPVDPTIDALWICAEASPVDGRCPAPVTTLPGSEFHIALSFRTHDIEAWRTPGSVIAYVGETTTTEIARITTGDTAGDGVATPGVVLTWTELLEMRAPDAGWPTDRQVYFQIRDGRGRLVAAASIQFTGAQVAPPPLHAQRILNVCSERTVAGLPGEPYCPVNEETIPHGRGHTLYTSYTSDDPALWTDGATTVLERRGRRGGWEEESTLSLDPLVLDPDDMETAETSYSLAQDLFSAHSHWRVRFVVRGETVSEREFEIE